MRKIKSGSKTHRAEKKILKPNKAVQIQTFDSVEAQLKTKSGSTVFHSYTICNSMSFS